MDNNVEIDYGTGGRRGKVGQKWKNWDNCTRVTIKKLLKIHTQTKSPNCAFLFCFLIIKYKWTIKDHHILKNTAI